MRVSEAVLTVHGVAVIPRRSCRCTPTTLAQEAVEHPSAIPGPTPPPTGVAAAVASTSVGPTKTVLAGRLPARSTSPPTAATAVIAMDTPSIPRHTPAPTAVVSAITRPQLDVMGAATAPPAGRSLALKTSKVPTSSHTTRPIATATQRYETTVAVPGPAASTKAVRTEK